MFYRKVAYPLGLVLGAVMVPQVANAQTATTTFPVSATVVKSCSVSANPLAFGNYDPTAVAALDATTTLSVLCTVGTSFTVGLSAGVGSGATVTTRQMTNGGNLLSYALYQTAARSTIWGNTPGTDTPAPVTAPATATTLTVYGRIPQSQNVTAGAYTDTITVSVNY